MRRRDWITIAATLLLIGLAYAYTGHADEQSALRDKAWAGKADK
jgi:hypothetical protein